MKRVIKSERVDFAYDDDRHPYIVITHMMEEIRDTIVDFENFSSRVGLNEMSRHGYDALLPHMRQYLKDIRIATENFNRNTRQFT
jgi:hypothetical protein